MIDFLFILRGLVYVQSFFWLYLLDKDIEINNYFVTVLFPTLLGITYLILDMTGFTFSQYTNNLLKFYIVMLLYSFTFIRRKYSFKDSVCLGFLLVFINSYYWEFMLHFNAIILYGISFNQIVQMFHLIPAYLLYKKLDVHNIKLFKKLLIYGLIISVLNLLSFNVLPNYIYIYRFKYTIYVRRIVNNLTRFICMNILLYVFLKYTELRKKEGDI